MPDIAINYELLNQLGKQTEQLRGRLSDALAAPLLGDAGNTLANSAIGVFNDAWGSAFQNAGSVLESLSSTYTMVAQQWFDQDASYSATANEQAAGFHHAAWQMDKDAFDAWQQDNKNQPPDPNNPAPPDPGPEPTSWSVTGPDGSVHTTSTTYDADGNITSADTTITDGTGGMQYHEHTSFGANGSSQTVADNTDGSTVTDTVNGNADGTGTRTVTTTDPQGNTTTQSYTGTGIGSQSPVWTPVDTGQGNDGSGTTSGSTSNPGGGTDPFNHGPKID